MTQSVRDVQSFAPTVRIAPLALPSGARTLLELRCAKPAATAVAFVCDLSDSCPDMKSEYEALGRLVGDLPRSWPVWFYALSSVQEIDPTANHTVGDLKDGSFAAADILRDRSRIEFSSKRGSLLSPTLESIAARQQREELASVLVIILTDGELLDAAPVAVPPGCRIVGVGPGQSGAQRRHWARVLPGMLLTSMDDKRLDEMLQTTNNPFFGRCELKWTSLDETSIQAQLYDSTTGLWHELTKPVAEYNSANGPAYLLLETTVERAKQIRLTCTALRDQQRISLPLDASTPLLDGFTSQQLQESLLRASQPVGEILLDISASHPEFSLVWRDFAIAHDLAVKRQRWLDSGGKLVAFRPTFERGLFQQAPGTTSYQAILCIATTTPGQACPSEGRLVMIGLSRSARPALRWKQRQVLPFGMPAVDVEMSYDRMEGRWMMRLGNQEAIEFDPNGSQKIGETLLLGAPEPWCLVFSGDAILGY